MPINGLVLSTTWLGEASRMMMVNSR